MSAPPETFEAVAVNYRGTRLGVWRSNTVRGAMTLADGAHPNSHSATVRGESTSDGKYWGLGRGRVVASREPRTLASGVFYTGWIVE